MIDPWPSYSKISIYHSIKVNQLIDWLFNADKNGYKLIGIIGTHEHYDHIADIPAIIFKLRNDKDRTLKNGFPSLYCDLGTFEEIKNRSIPIPVDKEGNFCTFEVFSSYHEIKLNGTELYYNDKIQSDKEDAGEENYPLTAGTRLTDITLGDYLITPYIWDHVSTSPYFDDLKGDPSGNYQRCTAIFLKQKNADHRGKSLLIIGSAGEMSDDRTGGFVRGFPDGLETDMLIQSVAHRIVTDSNYEDVLSDLITYQKNNIKVNDMIIASHFETFVDIDVPLRLIGFLVIFFGALIPFMPLGPGAGAALIGVGDVEKKISCFYGDLEKHENKQRVIDYADLVLPELENDPDNNNTINKIYYMKRFLIEYGFKIIVEEDDGYSIHDESILEHTKSLDPIKQIWNTEFSIFAIQGNSILLFKDKYLANPRTMEVHDLTKEHVNYNNNKMYYQLPGCNIHLMNFGEMKHFKTEDEAFKIIVGDKSYNGCFHCMLERDTDST